MQLTYADGLFVAETSFAERLVPKEAGFVWNRLREKRWATDDPERAFKLSAYADPGARVVLEEYAAQRNRALAASAATDAVIDLPVPDGRSYLPYQRGGIAFGIERDAVLIADEMGLGKTIQAIGIVNADPSVSRVLVVCPASLKLNWKRELERWLVRSLHVCVADSKTKIAPFGVGVLVVNYDVLHNHEEALRAMAWDVLIVDEAHYMKNREARRSVQVYGGAYRGRTVEPIQARRRVFLTGTPIVNRPVELWPLVHSLAPKVFPYFMDYARRYCDAKQQVVKIGRGRTRVVWDFSGASNLDELQERLRASIMVRRLKRDVLADLPAKRRQVIELPRNGCAAVIDAETVAMATHETKLAALRAAVELAKASDVLDDYRSAVADLAEGTRQAFTDMARVRHATALAKVPHVVDHLGDVLEAGGKVVCFAHHRDVIAAILEAFPDVSVSVTGDTPIVARQEAVDRFQGDEGCRLFVGNIQAAGVGLTLTASAHVVFAELDWVPGNVTQAEDRCHRIGQRESVLVQHLVLEGSLDAVMAGRLIAKQEVIDAALDDALDPVVLAEPILPTPVREVASTQGTPRAKLDAVADRLTPEQVAAIHLGLRILAENCDGADRLDGAGFNKVDTTIGKSLAHAAVLTRRQAALGRRMVLFYKRQLPAELVASARGALNDPADVA